jgi:hypothetical protein
MTIDSTIHDLVARGSARHPELRCKLEHAAFIVMFRAVSPELDGTWTVGSEREPNTSYTVNLNADGAFCTCQDSTRHPGQECKHSLAAVMLSRALVGLERHPMFDQVGPATVAEQLVVDDARVLVWHTIDDSRYIEERAAVAGLGRMPRAERED